jgi:hypothetical protein
MREEHRAAEKLFVDYAGPTIAIYNQLSGEVMLRVSSIPRCKCRRA